MLTKEQILSASDLEYEEVEIPEWGGTLRLRPMTGSERDAWETSVFQDGKPNFANVRARLVSLCAVDEKGERLFSEADAEALGKKSASALDRAFQVAQRLNALSPSDIEDLAKN